MKKQRIEHKIIREKDYLAPIVLGSFWTLIWVAINFLLYQGLTNVPGIPANKPLIAAITSFFFCFCVYQGIKHGFYDPYIREEVIHVIK